jgi:hypothetical protein
MPHWLRCRLAPGCFDTEFAASGKQANGQGFSMFIPKDQVQYEQEPPPRGHAIGWIPVDVWEWSQDCVVVHLPQPTLESGQYVTVKTDQVSADLPIQSRSA